MDLELTDAQRSARDTARRFAREKLERWGVEADRTHSFPAEAIAELSKLGMLGVIIPEQYGGAGLDNISYALVIEELAVAGAATAGVLPGAFFLPPVPHFRHGQGAEARPHLPNDGT